MLTNARLAPLFYGIKCKTFLLKQRLLIKGLQELVRLFRELNLANKNFPVDAVADLHNVLRSQIIRGLYQIEKE